MPDPAPGATGLLTLAQAKEMLKIPTLTTASDALLCSMIDGVSDGFNSYTGRILATATYTAATYNGSGSRYQFLPNYPLTAVTTVKETDEGGNESTITAYVPDNARGILIKNLGEGNWCPGTLNIKVTYVAGYVITGTPTIPGDLKLACLEQVAYEYKKFSQQGWGVTSVSYPDGTISKVGEAEFLPMVKATLDRYRRYGF